MLELLGTDQRSCSEDSFSASWKSTKKKVDIRVDTQLNKIQQCSLITNKATSTLNSIMRTIASRPFIPLSDNEAMPGIS